MRSVIQINFRFQAGALSAVASGSRFLARVHSLEVMTANEVRVSGRVEKLQKILPEVERQGTEEVDIHGRNSER